MCFSKVMFGELDIIILVVELVFRSRIDGRRHMKDRK
jgi:hypothetical protein